MRGAELAAEEINSTGGVLGRQLSLKVEDTSESVSGAKTVSAFRKLANIDDVRLIIGPSWAPGGQAILPMVKSSRELLLISPSVSLPEFAQSADHIFNMRASEELLSKGLARYAFKQGWTRAAIFSSQQPAEMANGRTFEDEFSKLGGEVTIRLEPVPVSPDLRTLAARIIASKPEVVYLISYTNMAEAAKQLQTLGYRGPQVTLSIDRARLEAAGGALEGVIVASFPGAADNFRESFVTRFGEEPGLSAEGGYDAVYAIAKAAASANSLEVSKLKTELINLEFEGASGRIKFDQYGQLIQEPVLMKAVGTELETIENG